MFVEARGPEFVTVADVPRHEQSEHVMISTVVLKKITTFVVDIRSDQ